MLSPSTPSRPVTAAASDERGFTLVELLVAMMSGMVIVLATFGLIDVTIRQSTRSMDRVEATASSRSFMAELVQELNSGCVVGDVSPVQAASGAGIAPAVSSDGQHLVFVSGLGSGASVVTTTGSSPVSLFEHVVSLANGTLTDSAYAATGGNAPTASTASTWTFSSTPTVVHVLPNVSTLSFTYYNFTANSNSLQGGSSNYAQPATAMTTPLSSTWPAPSTLTNAAGSVARVDLSLQAGPSDGSTEAFRQSTLNESVVFRLTPPTASSPNYPCD